MAEAVVQNDLADQFSIAANFLETVATQLGTPQLLEFYGLYKQATQGKCDTARPSWLNIKSKQKWDAWNALGDLSQADAMGKYVALLTQTFPNWLEESKDSSLASGWMAVSSMANEEPTLDDSEKEISDWIREGNVEQVKQLANASDINKVGSLGLGPIHWAADGGHVEILRVLVLDLKANVNLRDNEGQTALHYAAYCGHLDAVKFLVEQGANKRVRDGDGATPLSMASDPNIVSLLS